MLDSAVTPAPDYYEVLSVSRSADDETLKKAFRVRARAFHPDVSDEPGSVERFSELSEAYGVLSRPSSLCSHERAWQTICKQALKAKASVPGAFSVGAAGIEPATSRV